MSLGRGNETSGWNSDIFYIYKYLYIYTHVLEMYFKFIYIYIYTCFIFLERCHLKRSYSTPGYELGKNNYTRGELVAVKKPEVTFPKAQSNHFTVGQAIYCLS